MPSGQPLSTAAGLGAADTAALLVALRDALAELLPATARRFADEPRLEVRHALAAKLYDDARSLARLAERLAELPAPTRPAPAVPATSEAVGSAARDALRRIDPAVDDGTLRVLTKLAIREERHVDELASHAHAPSGASSDGVDRPGPAAESVALAEAAAAALADRPAAGDGARIDLARLAADAMRHAMLLSRLQPLPPEAREHLEAEAAHHARIRASHGL